MPAVIRNDGELPPHLEAARLQLASPIMRSRADVGIGEAEAIVPLATPLLLPNHHQVMANPSEAERLKAEGNALFVKNDFSRAYEKFTQAIKHDEENAILYIDAYTDASKGLDKYQEAITAWRRALAVLPVENLNAAQQKQRDLYAGKLAEAINNAERATVYVPAHVTLSIREEDKPWNRASKVLEALIPTNTWNSSAWVMVSAFTVVEALTNAVIEDTRAFVLTDQDFFKKYNQQRKHELILGKYNTALNLTLTVMVEITKSRAWTDGSARTVMEEAPKRVQSEGWETTRLALSVTVRAWIMRAFIQENLIGGTWAALDFYTSAIEVIRWGMQRWVDVPVAEKGSIFQPTFLRGMLYKAYKENPGPSSKMPLSEIFAGANELLNELASAPDEPTDEHGNPMFLCFTRYPLAAAHSFLGFYYQHTARNARQAGRPNLEVTEGFQAAAKAYLQSADIYPQDDEKLTLHCALDTLLEAGSPAQEVLALMNRIRDDIPVIKRIWEFSADAVSGRDTALERDMSLRNRLLTSMQEGKILHDDTAAIAQLKAEGDALFRQKEYSRAYQKYSEALISDPENAILYCNRAACSSGRNRVDVKLTYLVARYLDALWDAEKATTLDPSYAKAWARVGAAYMGLAHDNDAIEAWGKALAVLPQTEPPSETVRKQRAEYTALIAAAKRKSASADNEVLRRVHPWQERIGVDAARWPWNLAAKRIPSLKRSGKWNSSEWEEGVKIVKQVQVNQSEIEGLFQFRGTMGCLAHLRDALLLDSRVFKYTNPQDSNLMGLYGSQGRIQALPSPLTAVTELRAAYIARMEILHEGGWSEGGSQRVIKEATARLADDLTALRKALSITVSNWILCGWFHVTFLGAFDAALDYYSCALDVLEWGMQQWANVDVEERGLIFQGATVRAVKILRLEAYMQCDDKVTYIDLTPDQPGSNLRYILQVIGDDAEALIQELLKERVEPLSEAENSVFLGFVRYQLAAAYSIRGFYRHYTARNLRNSGGLDIQALPVQALYHLAAVDYLQAAQTYPSDDEHHFWSLYVAFNLLYEAGQPVGELLDILDRIHGAMPEIARVWEVALETGPGERKAAFESLMELRDDFHANIERGVLTRETPVMLRPS
ncbi:hypothetical protein ACG7TL_000916 [Trametes sanguinea]